MNLLLLFAVLLTGVAIGTLLERSYDVIFRVDNLIEDGREWWRKLRAR